MLATFPAKSLGTPNSNSSPAHEAAAKVKSKAIKSDKQMQLLDCFDLLPNNKKDALLEQLCGYSSTGASSKKNLDKAESANSESAKDVKVRFYDTWRQSARQGKPSITAPKFPHVNFRQACKSPLSHVLTGTLVMLGWSFVSTIKALIQSLPKRCGIKLLNPWSPRSPLGTSAVCLRVLILPNTMLQQMQYLGKPFSKTSLQNLKRLTLNLVLSSLIELINNIIVYRSNW
jgi:hypothetical protein